MIDKEGVDRLRRSLALGETPIGMYQHLARGRATDPISGQDLNELMLAIAAKPGGHHVAIEILWMRLLSDEDRKQARTPEIISAGCELMRQLTFTRKKDREDYKLGLISKSCLVGSNGAAIVREICRELKDSVAKYETYALDHDDLLEGLFSVQPAAALDVFFSGDSTELRLGVHIMRDVRWRNKNPVDVVPEAALFDWCDQESDSRYPVAAAAITISDQTDETGPRRWTSIALRLLEKAPDRVEVLRQFVRQFSPMSWSGSRAAIVESNTKLLDQLEGYPDSALLDFIAQEKIRLRQAIAAERRAETATDRTKDERFE